MVEIFLLIDRNLLTHNLRCNGGLQKILDVQERKTEKGNSSVPIMTRIYCRIQFLSKDTVAMANSLM